MLADLGLIGFVLFITAIASIGLAIGRLVGRCATGRSGSPRGRRHSGLSS
jgi:hypothetical protein